jgi:hypothetical protein
MIEICRPLERQNRLNGKEGTPGLGRAITSTIDLD